MQYNYYMKTFTDTQSLREELVNLMKTYGIKQLDVSRKTGLAQSAISLSINGKRSLSRGNLQSSHRHKAKVCLRAAVPEAASSSLRDQNQG
jgi:predicted transcriptional regulator